MSDHLTESQAGSENGARYGVTPDGIGQTVAWFSDQVTAHEYALDRDLGVFDLWTGQQEYLGQREPAGPAQTPEAEGKSLEVLLNRRFDALEGLIAAHHTDMAEALGAAEAKDDPLAELAAEVLAEARAHDEAGCMLPTFVGFLEGSRSAVIYDMAAALRGLVNRERAQ